MTVLAASEVSVSRIGLTAKWAKQQLQMYDWGITLDDQQIPWASISEVKYGKAKTNGGFRLRTDALRVEITFVNPWTVLAGLPVVMVAGARRDDVRLAWVHAIAERAGLVPKEGRFWVTFSRP